MLVQSSWSSDVMRRSSLSPIRSSQGHKLLERHMPEATAKVMVSAVHPEASGGSSEGEQAPRRASFGAANLRRLVAQASPVNATSSASQTSPSLSGVALDALRQQRQSEAPPACGSQASKMVDCNRSFSSLSRFLSSKSSLKKRHRRHAAPLPGEWRGAAKLERDLGDTVISVALSDDDSYAELPSTYFSPPPAACPDHSPP